MLDQAFGSKWVPAKQNCFRKHLLLFLNSKSELRINHDGNFEDTFEIDEKRKTCIVTKIYIHQLNFKYKTKYFELKYTISNHKFVWNR